MEAQRRKKERRMREGGREVEREKGERQEERKGG